MDATARWQAVIDLRSWERERLNVQPGEHLIDVGCGLGDVARGYAREVAPDGVVTAIDASEAMLAVARQRSSAIGVDVDFRVGDALALDVPDDSFDALRSERMLQWLPDPEAAFAEMVRVVRPGGRLVVTDADWRTLAWDLPDVAGSEAFRTALAALRGPGFGIGGRLLNLARDAGLDDVQCSAATHVWSRWDPDVESAPPGLFPMREMVGQLAGLGLLDPQVGAGVVDAFEDAGRRDRFCLSLTMMSVYARRP
jgi:SAM-dependent methyltransferase